ncbi:alpha-glucoside-specific phosphotransferase enzyme IIB component [Romboutsia weinsteinii]|uniref:Alpha-glucoside-specific phosphotransferase enzyme IIB component n=1 Tax=Romboutsia weinsteinii TaxID=2020949 RepID=A0A255II06_9FIRM|nr:alpha-glucoside-specific PTS transporter subunit IIBC [Romboutsia weinsteinii]RDY29369.1 alpha-glucoside-specific phosphotransferase enzyme IIB component [Romboutsia weinsteinii]
MMQKIQRFGSAMFTPVLLFAFAGIMVGLTSLLKNQDIVGSIANPDGLWYQICYLIEQGAWTCFNQLPLLFVIGLPIALAKKAHARACLEALVTYLTFNYFVNAILFMWGPKFGVDFTAEVGGLSGLTTIAGIKTLDTGMIGSIVIASIVVYLHNKFFDTELPEFLGIFRGSSLVVMIAFFVMIPVALLTSWVWPMIQGVINSMQGFLSSSGTFGVWIYTLLERLLIPTGLHHFVYTPFIFGPAVVEGGIATYWPLHLSEFATTAQSLKEMFPQGGFALHGLSKVFGSIGIGLAFVATAKPEKKKVVAGLVIPAVLTAVVAGITEPLEFTFLFVAPALFVVHALLAATLSAVAFTFGVVGNFGSGLIEWLSLNWIPLGKYHGSIYLLQVGIGLAFTAIYFFTFRYLILKFNFKTPGREDDTEEAKLYTKEDFKAKNQTDASDNVAVSKESKASKVLELLGGKNNIVDVTNCATRLRLSVIDETIIAPDNKFRELGVHGLSRNGKAIQVIIGLSVPQFREEFEKVMEESEVATTK